MQFRINLNAVVPVRKEPSETSEMVTQLLFGEICEVIDKTCNFFKIKSHMDGYIGWVSTTTITELTEQEYLNLTTQNNFKVCVPIADVFCTTDKSIYKLSAGSTIPFYNYQNNSFTMANKTFQIHPSFVTYLSEKNKENIVSIAMLFQNSPYLWGGKNIFGIDCSGFVQIVYSLCGYQLSRDTSTQCQEGLEISSLDNATIGDLIFFNKENKITHVGIYIGNNQIIHSSGKVRIDTIDTTGIYNNDLDEYTHYIASIRNI